MLSSDSLLSLPGAKRYRQGALIMQEGAPGDDSMFVLLKGSAGVFENYGRYNEARIHTHNPVSFFGETSLFLQEPASVSVVAETEAIVLRITRKNYGEIFANHPEIMFFIMESMCKRLEILRNPAQALAAAQVTAPPQKEPEIPAPEAFPADKKASGTSRLFPDGHGSYLLNMDNLKGGCLYENETSCPICGHAFQSLSLITSKLRVLRTDNDFRVHYRDIEPMHYEVVTCPACLYSAFSDSFPSAPRQASQRLERELSQYKGSTAIQSGTNRDTFTVFAGYYLAILCAPICFDQYQMTTAKLWLRLSRIYSDCGDEGMYRFALKRALEDYDYSYTHFDFPGKALHQVRYIIADIYHKLGDIDSARRFFYAIKSDRSITPVIARQVEDRLEELRNIPKGG